MSSDSEQEFHDLVPPGNPLVPQNPPADPPADPSPSPSPSPSPPPSPEPIMAANFKTSAVPIPPYFGDAMTTEGRHGIVDWIWTIEAIRDATLRGPEANRWTPEMTASQAMMALKGEALNFASLASTGCSQYTVDVKDWDSLKAALKANFGPRGTAKEMAAMTAMARQGHHNPAEGVRQFMQRCYDIARTKYELFEHPALPGGLNADQIRALRKNAIDKEVATLFVGGLRQEIKDHMNIRKEDDTPAALCEVAVMAEVGLREKNPNRNPWVNVAKPHQVSEVEAEVPQDNGVAHDVDAVRGGWRGRGGRGRGGRGTSRAVQNHQNFGNSNRGGGQQQRGGRGGQNQQFSRPFQGYCDNCRGWGHTKKFCPTPAQDKQQKTHAVDDEQPPPPYPDREEDKAQASAIVADSTWAWEIDN